MSCTARRELFGLRFQHATGELDNTAGLKRAKREIARALTVARERGMRSEMAEEENDNEEAPRARCLTGGRKACR